MKLMPPSNGLSRRDLFKYAGITTGTLALSLLLNLSTPEKIQALPFSQSVITDSDFLDPFPIDIRRELCSSYPDTVTFSGGNNTFKRTGFAPNYYTGLLCVLVPLTNRDSVGSLEVVATYNRVGIERESEREVGCRVTMNNGVWCDNRIIQAWINEQNIYGVGYGFGNFYSHTSSLWLLGEEAADVTQEFFYTDTLEPLSIKDGLTTLSSLDCELSWKSIATNYQAHEGCILPENVTEVFTTPDAMITIDGTLRLLNTYEHVIFGDYEKVLDGESAEYDRSNFSKHEFSWICKDDAVKYKFVTPAGTAGFNISSNPIANALPEEPIKT